MAKITEYDRFMGAMYGSAIGDAFGYPLRDLSYEEICERFEKIGALELAVSEKTETALFSDATQMAFFTIDGIIWANIYEKAFENASVASYVFYSYQLWLYTQTKTVASQEYAWLFDKKENPNLSSLLRVKGLTRKRYNLETNIKALLDAHNNKFGRLNAPVNTNSDNGAVKRVTPVGLFYAQDEEMAFRMACDIGAITHSSPDGYLPCGVYAATIAGLVNGKEIKESVERALEILEDYKGHERTYNEVRDALDKALEKEADPQETVKEIGLGIEAVEALAIAIYCAVLHEGRYKFAIQLASNHDGDSSACACLTGGLLGAANGFKSIPKGWYKKLQYKNLIETLTDALYDSSPVSDDEDDEEEEEEKPVRKERVKEEKPASTQEKASDEPEEEEE